VTLGLGRLDSFASFWYSPAPSTTSSIWKLKVAKKRCAVGISKSKQSIQSNSIQSNPNQLGRQRN